ncbi:hypothetical protein [Haloprofundus halobius]|uniref:hypothetical protein n=1 Tax=Haloprofundus halobius TaxID=2876194 RepID=UPI001CCC5C49|nr:hypothetical protein [Haloprofundus halobius]
MIGYGLTIAATALLAAVVALYVMQVVPRGVLSWYGLAFGAGLVGAAPVVADHLLGRLFEARRLARARRRQHAVSPSTTSP